MIEAEIKQIVTERVRGIADRIDWQHLTIPEKNRYYVTWTNDPEIGGLLATIMDPGSVRVYLKDSIIKQYVRGKLPELDTLLRPLGFTYHTISRRFIKPIGILCDNRDLYTLAVAKEWKNAIMSAHERGCGVAQLRRNIVFITDYTTGRFVDLDYQRLIEGAASRLGVQVRWVV